MANQRWRMSSGWLALHFFSKDVAAARKHTIRTHMSKQTF